MSLTRLTLLLGAVTALAGRAASLPAQAITTGAIGGQVTDPSGAPLDQVQIVVVNRGSGYSTGGVTRANGRYLILGLAVGGPYSVTVRRIGFAQGTRDDVRVSLSQTTQVDFQMSAQAVTLSGVQVRAAASGSDFAPTRQGTETTVGDTLIQRVPNLNRDFASLSKLAPQVSQPEAGNGGPSAGGSYNRFNNFTIDGANQNDRYNLAGSLGEPGGATGGRIISVDAVKEFQILMSPTDVRQGNFAGMSVNAVTKSGTNRYSGGASVTYRNPSLAYDTAFIKSAGLQVRQYAFQLGGPIIKDRLHFYLAPEWQSKTSPATGPVLLPGSKTISGATSAGTVSADSINAIINLLKTNFDPGTTGPVTIDNPLTNLFGRLDWQASANNRVAFRQLVNKAEIEDFSRNERTFNAAVGNQNSGFRLGSNANRRENKNNSSVFQLFSNNLRGGSFNELLVGYNTISDIRIVPVTTPEISVAVTPVGGKSPTAAVTAGTEQFSPNNILRQRILEINDNYTLPLGAAHTATLGARFEHMYIYNNFAQATYGVYSFDSIGALRQGLPRNYLFAYDNGGGIAGEFSVQQYTAYAQDQWTPTRRLTVTAGLRTDVPRFLDKPAFNKVVSDSVKGIRTDAVPKTRALWSPRVGFNWDLSSQRQMQLRGTMGVYTGLPPFILLGNAFQNTGLGLVTLTCQGATGTSATPTFTTDISKLPKACAGQATPAAGAAGTSSINVNDPNFKYPQYFTTSGGFDRELPGKFVFTFDALYRQAINGIFIVDANLRGPATTNNVVDTDPNGRVLYDPGTTATGSRIIKSLGTNKVNFNQGLIEVTNQSKDYNYSLTPQVRRRFGELLSATFAYTYTQSKDVQSFTSDRAISNFRNGRQYAGLQTDQSLTSSVFERPHRFVFYGSLTPSWRRWGSTDLSFFYEAVSGAPFTYVSNGDLNNDGAPQNDPLYIPRNARDTTEIRIGSGTGTAFRVDAARAQAFENFINNQECLRDQRGRIMERNSCHAPWQNRLDLSLRQGLPERFLAGQNISLQLDLFNAFNFASKIGHQWGVLSRNKNWGYIWLPTSSPTFTQQPVLTLRSSSSPIGAASKTLRNFEFDPALQNNIFQPAPNTATNFYQMQLSLRYSF